MFWVLFSGLPGTGKSTLADAAARTLHFPVFAKDWLEATIQGICSDEALHRARLATRQRNIPDWHELTWDEVEQVRRITPHEMKDGW